MMDSCDFDGVVPANDLVVTLFHLSVILLVTGSTGGSTSIGIGVEGCEVSPGTGVWYTFTGNGHFTTSALVDLLLILRSTSSLLTKYVVAVHTRPPVDAVQLMVEVL